MLDICQEDNLTQRRKDAKKKQVFWAEDTKIFCPNCGFALNFYLFDPCQFNPFRERNSPAPQRGEEKDKPVIWEGFYDCGDRNLTAHDILENLTSDILYI